MTVSRRPLSFVIATLLVSGMIFVAGKISAQSYIFPTSPTDTSNIAPSITSSPNTQSKPGTLRIGERNGALVNCTSGTSTGCSKLCLNADAASGRLDTSSSDCISSWSDLLPSLGGPYLQLHQQGVNVQAGNDAHDLSLYASQSGYVHVRPYHDATTPYDQRYALIAQAPSVPVCSYNIAQRGAGAIGTCSNNPALTCHFNSECGYASAALYATDSGVSSNYAAYFGGTVYVRPPSNDPSMATPLGRICLNGVDPSSWLDTSGGYCISSWNEVGAGSTTNYVQVQLSNPPTTQQLGGAIVSGVANFSSAIAGSSAGLPPALTCGDGFCGPNENTTSCAVDCASVATPPIFITSLVQGKVNFTLKTGVQSPAGNVPVIIARSSGATSNFIPIDGVTYSPGQVIGNSTIVYVGSVAQNTFVSITPDTLPAAGTYYYRAYQANPLPRYSLAKDSTLGTVYQLIAGLSYNNVTNIVSDDFTINCSINGDPGCRGFFLNSTTVVLGADAIQHGYRLAGWDGCDSSTTTTCTVTMTYNRSVMLNVTQNTGGGGGGGSQTDL